MMKNPEPIEDVLYERELLRVSIMVRDYFLRAIVSNIYENTGQLLSAVRVKLALLETRHPVISKIELLEAGEIVGQSIRNLRDIKRHFYPENFLNTSEDLTNALVMISKTNRNIAPEITILGENPTILPIVRSPQSIIIVGFMLQIVQALFLAKGLIELVIIVFGSLSASMKLRIQSENLFIIPSTVTDSLLALGGKIVHENDMLGQHWFFIYFPSRS